MVGIPASRNNFPPSCLRQHGGETTSFATADRSSRSASADGSGSALLFFGGALGVAAVVLMSPGIFAASGPE